jgi:hypothetical protein
MAVRSSGGLAALLGLGLAFPALAGDCRLALLLGLDVSGSVDADEDQLQRQGLARALLAPEVVRAFLLGGPVALYIFDWSGPFSQATMPPGWQRVDDEADLVRIATLVAANAWTGADSTNRTTALGAALAYAADALEGAPNCQAYTVDISGDGVSNFGPNPDRIYEASIFDAVTVNGLIVGGAQGSNDDHVHVPESDAALIAWFETEVLHGPQAFYVLAQGYADYERAMTVKLLRELELPVVSGVPRMADGA